MSREIRGILRKKRLGWVRVLFPLTRGAWIRV